ncbi:MAG TPA: NrfD/PsrC family molybdoenzyme membrane anchor subunit [Terriglobales bacterium]|nr:NrfD/PsrC family molybdoenzyme membrane anchor subunit [Terriglobales bacterium]
MPDDKKPLITPWRVILAIIFAAGLYATYLRFAVGWSAATNMSDAQPWGIWVGLATLCGVGLSAGGFATAAAVYLLGMERYRPICRTAIIIAFLGYGSVCVGYAYELGLPWRFWHPVVYWNRHSVLFEVCWCIIMYTTVLAIEFSPALVEKLPWKSLREWYLHWHHRIVIAFVLAGVLLSSLHQSFLGGLFIITKGKEYPLWYSTHLTTLFYLSAIPAGLAMIVIALYLSVRSLNVKIDPEILRELSAVLVPLLAIFAIFRGVDLAHEGGLGYLFRWRSETGYFWLEMALFVFIPIVLLNLERIRNSPVALYWTSAIVVMGFIANRINVSITGLERATHAGYTPKWSELAITVMLMTCAVLAFRYAVLYLDILPRSLAEKRAKWLANAGVVANA